MMLKTSTNLTWLLRFPQFALFSTRGLKGRLRVKGTETSYSKNDNKPIPTATAAAVREAKKSESEPEEKLVKAAAEPDYEIQVETVTTTNPPHSPKMGPYEIGEPIVGATYFWCACGYSKSQPFCDHSHLGTGFKPVKYTQKRYKYEVSFCGCKMSKSAPICDSTCTTKIPKVKLADITSSTNI